MSDYIERSVIERLLTIAAAGDGEKKRRTWARAICVLHDAPAADVAPVPRWIKVEDELPPFTEQVLLLFEAGAAVGCLWKKRGNKTVWDINDEYGWMTDVDTKPLYWMPLPELPKGD